MAIAFNPLHPVFAAECTGIDIGAAIDARTAEAIHTGMDKYAVLVFRRKTALTTQQQLAFTRSLGELEGPYTTIRAQEGMRLESEQLSDISNLGPGNRILEREDRKRLFGLGNQLWHSDSSYKQIPAMYSALCAHVIPPEGGNTEFADMRAAYDMLDASAKRRVEGLVAEHSRIFSKGALGFRFTEKEERDFEPVHQPLVRVHPRSARRSLFLSSHAGRIVGWPTPEAMLLLRELTEHATQREFVYRHIWQVGDLVMWDNQATMHRARPFPDAIYPRDLRRTTLTCGAPAVPAATPSSSVAA